MCPAANDTHQNQCDNCPNRQGCVQPCEKVEKLLVAPDAGRLSCNISKRKAADLEVFLSRANQLDARSEAIVYLYYRCGLAMERIAEAFEVNRSTVSRVIQKSWQKTGEKCNTTAIGEETHEP